MQRAGPLSLLVSALLPAVAAGFRAPTPGGGGAAAFPLQPQAGSVRAGAEELAVATKALRDWGVIVAADSAGWGLSQTLGVFKSYSCQWDVLSALEFSNRVGPW